MSSLPDTHESATTNSESAPTWNETVDTALVQLYRDFQKYSRSVNQSYVTAGQAGAVEDHVLTFFGPRVEDDAMQSLAWDIHQQVDVEGFFMKWNGKGIAVNPGANFMQQLHATGRTVRDIDYVIALSSSPERYATVRQMNEINFKSNQIADSLHVIHYHLNPRSFKELSPVMEPRYKQERGCVRSLDWYRDSQGEESIELGAGIELVYFSVPGQENPDNLQGIRLRLTSVARTDEQPLKLDIGYVIHAQGATMVPLHNLDVLIAAFGGTNESDLTAGDEEMLQLGYQGCYQLARTYQPRIMLINQFRLQDGDLRLAVVRRLREALQSRTILLPVAAKLMVDLLQQTVLCEVTGAWVAAEFVHVVQNKELFGRLTYLSSECLL